MDMGNSHKKFFLSQKCFKREKMTKTAIHWKN